MLRPRIREPGETLDVEGDDMGDARIINRHVRPAGMTGHRDEIELVAGAAQRALQRTQPDLAFARICFHRLAGPGPRM